MDRGGEIGHVGLGLTLPQADPGEIRGLGLFVFSLAPPDLQCEPYLQGTFDPISEIPEHLIALRFAEVPRGETEMSVPLDGISPGIRTILVECYDAGGNRIFLGCGVAEVTVGEVTGLAMDMIEDPAATDPGGSGG
jgi:hypothetical protein